MSALFSVAGMLFVGVKVISRYSGWTGEFRIYPFIRGESLRPMPDNTYHDKFMTAGLRTSYYFWVVLFLRPRFPYLNKIDIFCEFYQEIPFSAS